LVSSFFAEGRIAAPAAIVLYAFDLPTPCQADFIAACASAGVEILSCSAPKVGPDVVRVELESPRHEIEHAARWARSRLEATPPALAAKPQSKPKARSKPAPAGQGDLFADAPAAEPARPGDAKSIA